MYLRVCWSIAACLHTSGLRSPEFKRGSELQLSVHHYLMVTDGKEAEEALCYTGIFVAPYSYHRHHFSPLASPGSDPWWMLTERVSHHLISTNTPDQGQTTHKHEDRERDRVDTSNKKGGSNLGQIRPEFKLLIKSAYAAEVWAMESLIIQVTIIPQRSLISGEVIMGSRISNIQVMC